MDPLEDVPSDFLSLRDLTAEQLGALFGLADALRGRRVNLLEDREVAMLFEKPSTRTRVSFSVAVHQLGGASMFLSADDVQLARGETIRDTARTLSRYVRGIVCRTFEHERLAALAEAAGVPVVNALTDGAHPCQALADLYTVRSYGPLEDARMAYVGDGNNVCHSLMEAAALSGMSLRVSTPPAYRPSEDLLEELTDGGADIAWTEDPGEAVREADFVYTDVWSSMGDEEGLERRRQAFREYQVNDELLEQAPEGVRVMHCLPAHRGEEITDAVMDGPDAIVFDQAENRLHVQKALLGALLGSAEKRDTLMG